MAVKNNLLYLQLNENIAVKTIKEFNKKRLVKLVTIELRMDKKRIHSLTLKRMLHLPIKYRMDAQHPLATIFLTPLTF